MTNFVSKWENKTGEQLNIGDRAKPLLQLLGTIQICICAIYNTDTFIYTELLKI